MTFSKKFFTNLKEYDILQTGKRLYHKITYQITKLLSCGVVLK